MQLFKYIAITALSVTMTIARAGGPAPGEDYTGQEKPNLFTSHSKNITAMVEAINLETREVTLRGPEGKSVTFTTTEEALGLVRIKVGDLVNAEYRYHLSIVVYDNQELVPAGQKLAAMGRTSEDQMSGLGMVATHALKATIVALDIEAGTVKLEWPDETVDEFTARDPEKNQGRSSGRHRCHHRDGNSGDFSR